MNAGISARHKWLIGTAGAGFAFTRRRLRGLGGGDAGRAGKDDELGAVAQWAGRATTVELPAVAVAAWLLGRMLLFDPAGADGQGPRPSAQVRSKAALRMPAASLSISVRLL